MDDFSDIKASLPEPSVSEEGTFCDSFNDTISRLEQANEGANIGVTPFSASDKLSPTQAGANWDQKSEFVDPQCDLSSLMSKMTAPLTQSPVEAEQEKIVSGENDPEGGIEGPVDDRFAYNKHNESVFDDFRYFPSLNAEQISVVKFDEKDPECISHATLRALLVQLTSPEVIDYNLICDFFLTYRTFTDAHVVLNLLLTRLIWSLQYINSQKPETEKLGKLVLLRTFVVLRHWILNYFYDDFESDEKLCDLFAFHINQICTESALLAPHMAFEVKIFRDLKTHWLSQINEFFGRHFTCDNQITSVLPMSAEYFDVKRLTKSNTEASIHTNPSFRRSAMLSLYDQKTHHKCIVYDTSASNEAAQLPIGNLVNQHKSSRISLDDKLKEYYTKGAKRDNLKFTLTSRREPLAPKHNYSNLTDSSLALKKTSHVPEKRGPQPVSSVQAGFSTNGRIKLPSSRVTQIVPLSPVKKMRCSLKDDLKTPVAPYEADSVGRKRSIKRVVEGWTKSLYSPDLRSEKSTFSGESGDEKSTTETEKLAVNPSKYKEIGDRVDVLSARIVDELEFVIRYYIFDSRPTINEQEAQDEISRATITFSPKKKVTDILFPTSALEREKSRVSTATTTKDMSIQDLSELNIEKIDNLFSQSSIGGEQSDALGDSFNSSGRKSHAFSAAKKRASLVGSKRSSFGGRVASINWNDDGNLFLENSASLCDTSARPETKFYDVSNEQNAKEKAASMKAQSETQSSDLDFSDVEQYDAEVSDLGIAMSPQSLKKLPVQRISLHDRLGPSISAKGLFNLSRNSTDSLNKHESLKSYLTYDSAFSAVSESSRNEQYSSHLKKKHGYQDLRKLAGDGNTNGDGDLNHHNHHSIFARLSASSNVSGHAHRVNRSIASHISRTSSLKKQNTRLSTLCALTELPFNSVRDSYASASTRALFQDESGKLSDLSVSSVFSSAATREIKPAADSKDEQSNRMSSASVAIPGISNNILRELASIPDESFNSKNPVQYALYKLEGKSGSPLQNMNDSVSELETPKGENMNTYLFERSALIDGNQIPKARAKANSVLVKSEPRKDSPVIRRASVPEHSAPRNVCYAKVAQIPQPQLQQETLPLDDLHQNTEDILDEINNAVTEDAIGYSSDIEDELRNRPITPIKTRSKSTLLVSQSNSTANARYSALPTSESGSPYSLLNPKLVLDGYYLTSENLSAKQVMAAGSHISFILSYDSKQIAEHFTIIERDMLQEIDWKELIELKWNKELTPVNSWLEIIVNDEYYNKNKGVNLVIARFNLVVNWIISEILLTRDEDERREIVSRFIHIAYHSYEMQNFSTLMQIVLALTSEKVNKLKSTWNNLNPGDILTLKHLEQVSSPLKNFINMRVSTNQIKPSKGCIPFVGLYLSDLIFNAERPKFVKTKPVVTSPSKNDDTCELSVTQGDSTMTSNPGIEVEKMINFARFRTSVHIVKSLSQSIEWSQNYNVTVDDELLRKCLYIKSLDESEMNFCLEQLDT